MVEREAADHQSVGVLMLDAAFQRFGRDIGNAASLPFPTRQRRVPRASVASVVRGVPLAPDTRAAFVAVAQELVAEGARLITTSCGFLYREQAELAAALQVPVVASSLIALPMLQAIHGARGPIGILTFDALALGGSPIGGVPCVVEGMAVDSHFRAVIEERDAQADPGRLRADVVAAARLLSLSRPSVVVLECTNVAPWRDSVAQETGVPVVDLVDVIQWTLSSMQRSGPAHPADGFSRPAR